VGQAGDDDGRIRGVKLALFDISDLANPRQLGGIELGGRASTTPISEDHKAFLYDPTRQLLVVPVTEKSGYSCDEPPAFHGAKVFTLGDDGFTLRAAIEHGPNRSSTHAFPQQQREWACVSEACHSALVRRSLYVGDDLFTVSDGELRATSLSSYVTTWSAPLHHTEILAKEGGCTLDGVSLPWLRVAASGDDIWCIPADAARYGYRQSCRPSDTALTNHRCDNDGYRSFQALLTDAVAPCGNVSCADEVVYNPCTMWF